MNSILPSLPADLTAAMQLQEEQPESCVFVIFGASGDLTKRLLIPSLFNLYCDGLLPDDFAILGMAMDEFRSESFRAKLSDDIHRYSRRNHVDDEAWGRFCERIHYLRGRFDEPAAFHHLVSFLRALRGRYNTEDNVIFYMATPPSVFGMISSGLQQVGLNQGEEGWRRIIVEKPFGTDLASARKLNKEILAFWDESQVYRIDHYLGKEAVQNLLAFRFANSMFEPLWNRTHIDHIQITATEQVGVEWRGGYYDKSGVVRDMIQNHLFQMMAYLCMEPPTSFEAEAIRNEKYKLLSAVRTLQAEDIASHAVRGQYAAGENEDGTEAKAYREEYLVDPSSNTETFAALKLYVDNWRWRGVPIFLRSGKGLRTKSTEITVQFRQAPEFTFRGTPASQQLEGNQLIFHIQPASGIDLRILAKRPGPSMHMRKVNMHFDYGEAFVSQPGTGYETMLYDCMHGDASLFSRSDLVETAWHIVQPVLDYWQQQKPKDFPNYPFRSWGPKAAFELLEKQHRNWLARTPEHAIDRIPLLRDTSDTMRRAFAMMLQPVVYNAGDTITHYGSEGRELFIIEMGEVDIFSRDGALLTSLKSGQVFGELSMLLTEKRQASTTARTYCAIYMMKKRDFCKVLMDHPAFAQHIMEIARERYNIIVQADDLTVQDN